MANVRLLRVLALLSGLRFGLGIWVLYYLRLTDYAGIGLAETVTIVTAFAMEVPTGVAADRWGRKPCLVASFALELAGYLLLAAAQGLVGLLASLFVLQLGKALQSGTFEAMLWESLPEPNRERDYVRFLGGASATRLVALAGACFTGGFLYEIDPRLPFLAAAAAFAVAACAALGLREPARVAPLVPPRIASAFTEAASTLARAWRLTVPLLLIGAFLAVTEEVLDDVLSVEFGFGPRGLGALLAVAYLGAAVAAHSTHRLERRLGRRSIVFGIALVSAVTLVASPRLALYGGGLTVLLRHAMRSVSDTVVAGRLAAAADPGQRATVISLYQAARRLPYVALAWSVGAVMDRVTARGFALWFGLAMAAATAIAWRLSLAGGQRAAVATPLAEAEAATKRW